ncbi:MAG: PEGA domain-containing protein, partial [Myxococcota bacterium]
MTPPAPARLLLAAGLTVGAGCAHHMSLVSDPPGAVVTLGGTRVGVTPLEVPVPVLGTRVLRVELTGYRPLTIELGL